MELDGVSKPLPISDAYLLHKHPGFDPREEWEIRGLKAHDVDRNRLDTVRENAVEEYVNSSSFNADQFGRVQEMFVQLLQDPRDAIRDNFPDREFYFVIGIPRSGGHYLLRNLLKLDGFDLSNFVYGMVSDFCPSQKSLLNVHTEEGLLYTYFELAQMLAWMEDVFGDATRIYKKQTAFSYVIPLLDEIFGEQATYLVTVRHPITCLESKIEFDLGSLDNIEQILTSKTATFDLPKKVVRLSTDIGEEQWDSLPVWKKHCLRWFVHYTSIVDEGGPSGTVTPLKFGEAFDRFLERFEGQIEASREHSGSFDPRKRNMNQVVDQSFVEDIIGETDRMWGANNYEFPELN